MRSSRGFGKNYFSFSAVLAYSTQNSIKAKVSSMHSLLLDRLSKENKEVDEDEPPLEVLEAFVFCDNKPYHCDCFYRLKTKLATLLHHFIPRCPYYNAYFAFRRSGIHPPFIY